MNLVDILNKDLFYVFIDKVYTMGNTNILEFFIWETPSNESTNITGYRAAYPVKEAIKMLEMLFKKRVPSNYYISDLESEEILTAIKVSGDTVKLVHAVFKGELGLCKIELKQSEDSFHNQLMRVINKGAKVITPLNDEPQSMNNLIMNRENFNLSLRCFSSEGFQVFRLFDNFPSDLQLQSICDLDDIPGILKNNEDDTYKYYQLNLSEKELEAGKIILNGKSTLDERFLLCYLQSDYYIREFALMQTLDLKVRILSALNKILTEEEYQKNIRYSKSKSSRSEVTCIIKPGLVIPTIVELTKLMQLHDLRSKENLPRFINEIESKYNNKVASIVSKTLKEEFNHNLTGALQVTSIRLKLEEVKKLYALKTVRCHYLKYALSQNQLFTDIYCKDSPLTTFSPFQNAFRADSPVFGDSLYLRTIPNMEVF